MEEQAGYIMALKLSAIVSSENVFGVGIVTLSVMLLFSCHWFNWSFIIYPFQYLDVQKEEWRAKQEWTWAYPICKMH